MKFSLRKSWWWLMPLVVLLPAVAVILPAVIQHHVERRAAEKIFDMGGRIEVNWKGPQWMFSLASDDCRARYPEQVTVEAWGPPGLRKILGACGMNAYMDCFVRADSVSISIHNQDTDPQLLKSSPADLPQLLQELSHFSKLRSLEIDFALDCELDSRTFPQSLEALVIVSHAPDHCRINLSRLPERLEFLHVVGVDENKSDLQVDLSGIAALHNLKYLELESLRLNDQSLETIKDCTPLTSLSLKGNVISDAGVEHLRRLTNLELLVLDPTTISDRGLDGLARFPKLSNGSIGIVDASDAARDRFRDRTPGVTIRRVNLTVLDALFSDVVRNLTLNTTTRSGDSVRHNGFVPDD